MALPTNQRPRGFARRTGRDVWSFAGPVGYQESIQAAGTIVAPLLAAASFTLAALVLQASQFGRWENAALLLFVAAGISQVFAVQSVIWTRRYLLTPDELKQRYPDDFTAHGQHPSDWLRQLQQAYDEDARKWAGRTRVWVNIGILLLLAGIAVGVVPAHPIDPAQWLVITVAWIGVAVEASWAVILPVGTPGRVGLLLCAGAFFTSGGATAAAGFAATSGSPGGAATWWAVALAVAAAFFWLAACTGIRLSWGRLRMRKPVRGGGAIARAALALVAPAVFVAAPWAATRALAREHQQLLRDQHRGVRELLPAGMSLGVHHRAWNRCWAMPVTTRDSLAAVLSESGAVLGPGGQPGLDALWDKLVRSPGCVVTVVDRDDELALFGYYAAYPLTPGAVVRFRQGLVTSEGQLGPGDLTPSPARAAGWYIAVVWAPGPPWTRRSVIATLADALVSAGAGSAACPAFATPTTAAGRSLLKRYGFTTFGGQATGAWTLEKRTP